MSLPFRHCKGCGKEVRRDLFIAGSSRCAECILAGRDVVPSRLTKHGLDWDSYNALLVAQRYRCAICKALLADCPCIDHCHATGAVRGLLCRHCNLGLGHFKDAPGRLESAAAYLRQHAALADRAV